MFVLGKMISDTQLELHIPSKQDPLLVKKCTACEEDCDATFICSKCHSVRFVCSSLPGGFTSRARNVCVICYEEQQLTPTELIAIRRREYDMICRERKHRKKK